MKTATYTLSIEKLEKRLGKTKFGVVSQHDNIRTSCVYRVSGKKVLTYNVVIFADDGVALDKQVHTKIIKGKPLGKTIRSSGVPHQRAEFPVHKIKMKAGLGFIFATSKSTCLTRQVDYYVRGRLYASIHEYYNPDFTAITDKRVIDQS
ncbi:MAG: hypothetical protein WC761_06250 [Candidatus Paceibacterota bacterium]|jgi:hypothetical protein